MPCFPPIEGEGGISGRGREEGGSWWGKGWDGAPYPYYGWEDNGGGGGYGSMVALELEEVEERRGRLRGRIDELGRCGEVVAARECECCGEVRPGSGTFGGVRRSCGGRSCPYCSWVRAQERVELLRYAAVGGGMAEVEGYRWQLLTQSLQYDSDRRSEDMSVEGLRRRILMVSKMAKELWARGLKADGAAFLRCIEVSVKGHVHMHAMYYGPPVTRRLLEEIGKKFSRGRGCRSNVRPIKGGKNGVARATRYVAKGVKGSAAAFNEDYLAGDRSGTMLYPQLAARWELAAANLRLAEAYGALRGLALPAPEKAESTFEDDGEVECSCGAVGRYKTVYRNARQFVAHCHYKGKAALRGNTWLPYWMRGNVRKKKQKKRCEARLAKMRGQAGKKQRSAS